MKKLSLFIFILSLNILGGSLSCNGLSTIKKHKASVVKMGTHDKFRHCSISCLIARDCGIVYSMHVGLSKEVYDIFTPGDASIEDMTANNAGIILSKQTTSNTDCFRECSKVYVRHIHDDEK